MRFGEFSLGSVHWTSEVGADGVHSIMFTFSAFTSVVLWRKSKTAAALPKSEV